MLLGWGGPLWKESTAGAAKCEGSTAVDAHGPCLCRTISLSAIKVSEKMEEKKKKKTVQDAAFFSFFLCFFKYKMKPVYITIIRHYYMLFLWKKGLTG